MYAKVSKKGQVTIPKRIRELLNIESSGNVLFIVEDDEVKLKGAPTSDAEALSGSLQAYAKTYVDLKTIRRKLDTQIAEEIAEEGIETRD